MFTKVANQLVADERLCLDSKRKEVVLATDPRAAFLLAAKGQAIPQNIVKTLGLTVAAEPERGTEPKRRTTRTASPDFTR